MLFNYFNLRSSTYEIWREILSRFSNSWATGFTFIIFLPKAKKHFLLKLPNNKSDFSSIAGHRPSVKFCFWQRTRTNKWKQTRESLYLRLNSPNASHLYQKLSLISSEAYAFPNYSHKTFLNHILTAEILHLHKQKELSILLVQKQRNQMHQN